MHSANNNIPLDLPVYDYGTGNNVQSERRGKIVRSLDIGLLSKLKRCYNKQINVFISVFKRIGFY